MKSTGIVRRIDDLGRIVIPKEIRKNLKIKENETLEIFVDNENIILKKFSNISNMQKLFDECINVLKDITNNSIIITDRDNIVAATKKESKYIGKEISEYLDNILNSRNKVLSNDKRKIELVDGDKLECNYYIIPMIENGDIIGLLIMLSNNEIDEYSKLSLEIISKIIINSIE